MESRFRLPARPVAKPEAVVSDVHWRITVLTDGLIRLEWSPEGGFEDRASTFAWFRDLPVPDFDVLDGADSLEILTERLHLTYDRARFSTQGLQVQARGRVSNHRATWRYGTAPKTLGGTARTLDMADGRIELEPGIISRDGIGIIDDSASFLFSDDGWIAPRVSQERIDLYVFAYGHDYSAALEAFYAVSGPAPVVPRWALGNWWSRYHRYSADSYLALMDRFADDGLPLAVAVLDMDWHRVESVPSEYGTGWTGYSWEPSLFPDPEGFLAALHDRGLHVTLNVHPHEGVQPFEDAYPAMAQALGRPPDGDLGIAFDPTDREFLGAYFSILHRGLERQGVDFWWIDWQQGTHSKMPGVDPLWVLNHFHFLDSGHDGRRPITFSRYGGPGSHRYPVGFSGDTVITWASLDFQPEFTATASNIGYGWWSHDIGGHLGGVRDDELALRWLQYGVFSPITRLHSSSNPFLVKEPWMYPTGTRRAMEDALRLRHRLVPYLHTMNHRASQEGTPLVRPMYHLHPDEQAAYEVPNQYAFGDRLVVAPITAPKDPITMRGKARAWLPEGLWADLFTGVVYDGGRRLDLHRDDSSIPVLMGSGGVLVLSAPDDLDAARNPERLELIVVPGADGSFVLIEDDGTGHSPDAIPTATTECAWRETDTGGEIVIAAVEGPEGVVPSRRSWTLTLIGPRDVPGFAAEGRRLSVRSDRGRHSATVQDAPTDQPMRIVVEGDLAPVTTALHDRMFETLNAAQCANGAKLAAWQALTGDGSIVAQVAELQSLETPSSLRGALVELLTAHV